MEIPKIYSAIIDAMGQISAVSKSRTNGTQGFAYRGIDDVMNELHGILAKSRIFIVPTVLAEERTTGTTSRGGTMFYTRLKIKFTFYADDGSNVESVVIGEAMDTGDKASNKALSIGLKYALLQVFCIPTEDDKDPDAVSQDFNPSQPMGNAQPTSRPIQQPAMQQPNGLEDSKNRLQTLVKTYSKPLEGKPLELANETLLSATTVEQVEAMNKRVCDYLGKMGIKVN
jgi:hypothetical protein